MRTHTEYVREVNTIIADQLGIEVEEIIQHTPLRQQGADSLDDIELIMAVEAEFDIEVPDEVAENLTTVDAIVVFLEQHLGVKE